MRNIYNPIEVDEDMLLRDDEKHELLYSKINALPENLQDLLFDQNTDDVLKKIAGEFQLNQNQTIEMVRLVRDIIIKDVQTVNIVTELASRLQIGGNTAREMANELNTNLFGSVIAQKPSQTDQKVNPVKSAESGSPKEEFNRVNPNNVLDLRK